MGTRIRKLDYVALAALACYGLSVLPFMPRDVANVAASALCFVLTGVALASAILPGRVSPAARFAAIIACALGTGIVGGLILNLFPSGLVLFNWVTYALMMTLTGYTVGRVRGAGNSALRWSRPQSLMMPSWGTAAKLLAAAGITTAAVVISVSSWSHADKPFTEVWLLPDGATHSPVGATGAVLGMKSHESSMEDFTVVLSTGDRVTTSQVNLAPNQVWTQAFAVDGEKAQASVYRGGQANVPYRTVWFVTR